MFFLQGVLRMGRVLFLAGLLALLMSTACSPSDPSATESGPDVTIKANCEGNATCESLCRDLFGGSADLVDKCFKQGQALVKDLSATIGNMKDGKWLSISADSLKALVDFDPSIWGQYAGANNEVYNFNMLLWVAENEAIAQLLDEEQQVLKKAFTVVGEPASKGEVVKNGMLQKINTNDGRRNFFEVSAHHNNKVGFESAHTLLKTECQSKTCVKNFYCDINKAIVFQKLNQWELTRDAKSSGELNSQHCRS